MIKLGLLFGLYKMSNTKFLCMPFNTRMSLVSFFFPTVSPVATFEERVKAQLSVILHFPQFKLETHYKH